MTEEVRRQILRYRLRAHHLDRLYPIEELAAAAGACGFQNSPPGAWESAAISRIRDITSGELRRQLYQEKSLVQAWSYRGVPVVFPREESDVFLTALTPREGEEWIYTHGIGLALQFLQMSLPELLQPLEKTIVCLNDTVVESKRSLDELLAGRLEPELPEEKRALWRAASMYDKTGRQTVGEAAVSFLLRPCSLRGLVVFGERKGRTPAFTSYAGWLGKPIEGKEEGSRLARKFLHCYGPAKQGQLAEWLGCSGQQARRLWDDVAGELVSLPEADGAWLLREDWEAFQNACDPEREVVLLSPHDPYLDQRDREVLLPDRSLQNKVWKINGNPGVIVRNGSVIGTWRTSGSRTGVQVMDLWEPAEGTKLE